MKASADAVLEVSAAAEAAMIPDSVRLTVTAEASEDWSGDAVAKVSVLIANAVDILMKEDSVLPGDISISGIQLFSEKEDDGRWTGESQKARQTLTAILHGTDKAGMAYTSLSRLGGIAISSPVLFASDPEPFLDKARKEAVSKAMHRAEVLAEAAGVTLRGIRHIQDRSEEKAGLIARAEATILFAIG